MQYKNREEIPTKYKYDLDAILEGLTIEQLLEQGQAAAEKLLELKDVYFDSKEKFIEHIDLSENFRKILDRISNYISNNLSVNLIDPYFNQLEQQTSTLYYGFKERWGDEDKRLLENEAKVKEWLKDEKLAAYRKDFNHVFEAKKYRLSDDVEEFLNNTAVGNVHLDQIFSVLSNSEVDFGYATSSDGKRKEKITIGNRFTFLEDEDEEFRKTTTINFNKGYATHKQSFARLLISHFKKISAEQLLRGHKSTVHSYLFQDQIDEPILPKLYAMVSKHAPLIQKYWANYQTFFEAKFNKEFKVWDMQVPLVKLETNYTIEEAQELILKAVKPLGEEYVSVIKKAFTDRWIDYIPVQNKRSGAYSIGSSYPLEKKYIMMNYANKLNDVKTLAHELGHSMHSYYSDLHQPYNLSQYPIFLAEIASIFNELMMNDYLIENTDDDNLKLYLLSESIRDFQGTVFRQVHFSEYEYELYKAVDNREPLGGFEDLQKLYAQIGEKYKLHDLPSPFEESEREMISVIVPHFYYNFYVYKYAIGYIVANVFFNKYKQEGQQALQNYINNFLSKGSSQWPYDLLKESGIDLYKEDIYNQAFNVLEQKINQFIELGKKVFKK